MNLQSDHNVRFILTLPRRGASPHGKGVEIDGKQNPAEGA